MSEKNQEKDEGQELRWNITLAEMEHKDGFSYPVFTWSYGTEAGPRGGELRAWPLQGILVFKTRRGEGPFQFRTIGDALAKIGEYGWGKPARIDEVFADLQNIQRNFPQSAEEAKKFFGEELWEKWEELIK